MPYFQFHWLLCLISLKAMLKQGHNSRRPSINPGSSEVNVFVSICFEQVGSKRFCRWMKGTNVCVHS